MKVFPKCFCETMLTVFLTSKEKSPAMRALQGVKELVDGF
jgi:hypothetical protein